MTQNQVFRIDTSIGSASVVFDFEEPQSPKDIVVTDDEQEVFIIGNERLFKYAIDGSLIESYPVQSDGLIGGMAYDECGLIYYCSETGGLYKFDLEDYETIKVGEMGISCNDLDNLNLVEPNIVPYLSEVDCETGEDIGLIGPDGPGFLPIGCQQFGGSACDNISGKAIVAGELLTEGGELISDVNVSAISEQLGYPREDNVSGVFAFVNNPMYNAYEIASEKDNGHLNGVSTLDLVLIQKHILGLKPLSTGYKLIAADANNDERLTATDLVELRKLILGVYSQLPENSSWRFVNNSFVLDDQNPWPFVSTRTINSLDKDMMDEDFVGVKIGDVNGSVIANVNVQSTVIENRSSKSIGIQIQQKDRLITFTTDDDFNEIYGFQFTMSGLSNLKDAVGWCN